MSKFFFDRQTVYELQIFSEDKNGSSSIIDIFNHVTTEGGKAKLNEFFRKPLNDIDKINNRQKAIKYFIEKDITFPIVQAQMDIIEVYFYSKAHIIIAKDGPYSLLESMYIRTFRPSLFHSIYKGGVLANLHFINKIESLCQKIISPELPEKLQSTIDNLNSFINITEIKEALDLIKENKELSFITLIRLDKILRETKKSEYTEFMDSVYEIDLYISLAKAISKNGFSFPIFDNSVNGFEIDSLYHPFISSPITNDFKFEQGKNFAFLTGPNMAGKTTLLKSLGLSIYLSHLGLAVPCKQMSLSVFNGLYTSLNTEDNLSKGYSYFYSEVLRVKNIAKSLHQSNKMFIIFDELFKGTNVKDAFDGSLLVVDGLTNWNNNFFILSSHLLELGQQLMKYPVVQFQHFSCSVEKNKPVFSYKLQEGLSDDRIGLLIIKSEGIPELLVNPDK